MIGKIEGRLDHVAEDHALLVAGGVGYEVYCGPRTLAALPRPGEYAALYTEMIVREDLMQLVGFATIAEKAWWRLLTSVQGVGAKAGLAMLDALGAEGIARAIALGDAASVRRAPGVGPKIAARVVNELKDKAPSLMAMGARGAQAAMAVAAPAAAPADLAEVLDETPSGAAKPARRRKPAAPDPAAQAAAEASAARAQAQGDALSALGNLGYAPAEAAQAVAEAAEAAAQAGTQVASGLLIREALRRLAPKG